ncbi:MAG: serine/threonine protein kinase [Planctomycetales bacterium]|nr:serine/threonine protein kinase [Planctomycetales bacterium]
MPPFSTLTRRRRGQIASPPTTTHSLEDSLRNPRVGSWELLRRVHRGEYADVYLSRPAGAIQSCADYVVKVLREERCDDPTAVAMMTSEAAAGRAVLHPHLAPVLEAHLRSTPRHLVMPRLEGVPLSVLLREGQCGLRRALRTARQVAEALAELHDHGWRHGDVKPANVMISPEGHATLIDLSMAAPVTQPGQGLGTPTYAAPELQAGTPGASSDVYSLGVMLFELLAGRAPFELNSPQQLADAHREEPAPSLRDLAPQVPAGAARLVRRMLQKSPHDRPFATEVIEELTPLEIEVFADTR